MSGATENGAGSPASSARMQINKNSKKKKMNEIEKHFPATATMKT